MTTVWITPLEKVPATTRWELRVSGRAPLTFLGTWPLLAMALRKLLRDDPAVDRLVFIDVQAERINGEIAQVPTFHSVSDGLLSALRESDWVAEPLWDLFAWSPEILADKPSSMLLRPHTTPERKEQ